MTFCIYKRHPIKKSSKKPSNYFKKMKIYLVLFVWPFRRYPRIIRRSTSLGHATNSVCRVKKSLLMRSMSKEHKKRSLLIQIASSYAFETSKRPRISRMLKKLPEPSRIGLQKPEKLP